MIRTVITPENTSINLSVPSNYVGRKIEIMCYPIDELIEEKPLAAKSMASFRGVLSENEGKELQEYVKKSREEWDKDF